VSSPPLRETDADGAAPARTRWHEAVERLNVDTCEAAESSFARGETAGARQFVWEPLRAFAAAALRGGGRNRLARAVLAGYWWVARAAKLWEVEMHWDELHLEHFARGRVFGVVRRDWRETLRGLMLEDGEGEPIDGGRGGTSRIATDQGGVVVRRFRRGGAMRWLGALYFGPRPRPLREFSVLLRARRRGLAVPEPLAAVVERRFGVCYRGRLLMREVVGGTPLLHWLEHETGPDIVALLARALRDVHDAGLDHPDLNLGNVLVVARSYGPRLVFVDLDRARLRTMPLGVAARRRSLARLRRSAAKLDPQGRLLSAPMLDRLEKLYWRPEPALDAAEERSLAGER
jgi:3-deoxy-D-manno-octulosonic acid kinase